MPECGDKYSSGNSITLLIWDLDGSPPKGEWTAVLWRDFGDSVVSEVVSIPTLVEKHADDLKSRYLAWVYELGEMHIKGRSIIDRMELRQGFSSWWMTLLAEKCTYSKSPQITNAIRLMAFESWTIGRVVGRVVLVSANQPLAVCIRSWCTSSGIGFEWQRRMSYEPEKLSWTKRLYLSLPHFLQALAWLVRYLANRWPLHGVGLSEWRKTEGRTTFVSYLDGFVPDTAVYGRFTSRYWAHLPDNLRQDGRKINWLHLYIKDEFLSTPRAAANAIRQFNTTGQGAQVHVSWDTFLSVRVVFSTLRDWGRMAWACRRLHSALSLSRVGALNLWPLFKEDWQRSIFGQTAINNLLYYNLFESALKSLPKQQVGVYLQENQGWEMALIHAWNAGGHGRLIGSPHSTVRFWDLRYFFDPRTYCRTGVNGLPMPDQVATNGVAAMDAYKKGVYPKEGLVEVEALRYLYLGNARAQPGSISPHSNISLRILVLGDYMLSNTRLQMRLLKKVEQYLPDDTIFMVKPHPNCPVQPADYLGLKMEVTLEPVWKLLAGCDVAYTSSLTAAAVDAYCAGVPVVSVSDPNTLNLSPLRGREGVFFATTPEELAHALVSASSAPHSVKEQKDFFTLDCNLPRWRKLLLETGR
jgi:surface carbohydrate biosynthesis protein (TIGR04326 family)